MSEMDKDILDKKKVNSKKKNEEVDKKKSVQKKTTVSQVKNDNKVNISKSNKSNKRKRKRKNNQVKEAIKTKVDVKEESNKKNIQSSKKDSVRNIDIKENKDYNDKNNNKRNNDIELNKRKHKKKRKKKKRWRLKKKFKIIGIIILILFLIGLYLYGYKIHQDKIIRENDEQKRLEIASYYNQYVKTNKDVDIYKLENDKYIKIGKIGMNEELVLEEKDMYSQDGYFKIVSLDEEYYIYYKDIESIDNLVDVDLRYKKYILYNKNIVTNDVTSFYDIDDNLVYTFNKSFDMPIIVNKKDIYGVEYNNRLLYVKKEDVKEIRDNNNTDLKNTNGIAVLNYHFFFDSSKAGESSKCSQSICLSTSNLRKHLDYISDNNIFTPTMKELEMYIDGYIKLPKSVVLTIDDGWRADIGSNIMAEYKLNGTVFLMSKDYDPNAYKNEYIEVHSHGHDLHKQGVCPGGQGGAIKCLEKTKLLEDLKTSHDKLDGTTVFCYPFYEYNNYSIEILKEAGYTMAFGGYNDGGKLKVEPGINKYRLPRYVIEISTSVNNIASYIN